VTQVEAALAFVQESGVVRPREVDAHFAHGHVHNWFGGSSNVSTQLLSTMNCEGMLRGGAPQWETLRPAAFARAKVRLASCDVGGTRALKPTRPPPNAFAATMPCPALGFS
jgi:hypothetical protein